MTKQIAKISIYLLTVSIIALGCFSPVTADLEYNPEYLGPIAYANVTPEEFAETIEPEGTYAISPSHLNIPGFQVGVPVDVPPTGPVDLPPQYREVSDIINSINAEEATFTITFTNNFPITFSQGTRLVAFDSSTQTVMFDHAFSEDVEPGTTYENIEVAANKTLTGDWGMQVKDLHTPGGEDVVFEDDTTSMRVKLSIVEFLSAELNPDKRLSFAFNTPVDFSITDSADAYDISGYLSLFFENNLPVDLSLKLSLVDAMNDTVFRFFNGQTIVVNSPPIDAGGYTTGPNQVDYVNIESLDTLQQLPDAVRLSTKMTFITPASPGPLKVNDANFFKIKLATRASAKIDIQE